LIIGWVFASFLQGVGGFGVPVAVIAPLLVGLGFAPMQAVIIPSLGHGWAVTFGSLGSSFQALIASSGLPGERLSPWLGPVPGNFRPAGWINGGPCERGQKGHVPAVGSNSHPGNPDGNNPIYPGCVAGLWNIAAFGAGMAGLLAGIPLARRFKGDAGEREALVLSTVAVALSGYMILIAMTLGIQLVPDSGKP
jgi:lactate permease